MYTVCRLINKLTDNLPKCESGTPTSEFIMRSKYILFRNKVHPADKGKSDSDPILLFTIEVLGNIKA